MSRSSLRYEDEGLRRGPWADEEDQKLTSYVQQHGHGSWNALPEKAGLRRCGRSCRLRWINYLRPDVKRGKFSLHEEQTIIRLHAFLGNRWSTIAAHLQKRTDNEIKNHWNTHLKKKLIKMGIDPTTHKRSTLSTLDSFGHGRGANLSHMAQWEKVRLEAEARATSRDSSNKQVRVEPKIHLGTGSLPINTRPRPKCIDVMKAWQGMVAGMFINFPNCDNIDSPTLTIANSSNGPINESIIGDLYTSNESGYVDDWKCFEKFHMQELEDWILDESSSMPALMQEAHSTENAWFADKCM